MWASQDATLPRAKAESGPIALGSLCSVATGCRGSHSIKRSEVRAAIHRGEPRLKAAKGWLPRWL
jgi:hypothetical protein